MIALPTITNDDRHGYIWLIPLLPGLGAAINGLSGSARSRARTAGLVACATMTAALALSVVAFWQLLGLPAEARAYDVDVAEWIPAIPLADARRRSARSRCRGDSGSIRCPG